MGELVEKPTDCQNAGRPYRRRFPGQAAQTFEKHRVLSQSMAHRYQHPIRALPCLDTHVQCVHHNFEENSRDQNLLFRPPEPFAPLDQDLYHFEAVAARARVAELCRFSNKLSHFVEKFGLREQTTVRFTEAVQHFVHRLAKLRFLGLHAEKKFAGLEHQMRPLFVRMNHERRNRVHHQRTAEKLGPIFAGDQQLLQQLPQQI
mmetsp:Transcript_12808/g.19160  ORF Transcript_12808/g.19160 Transcript_12808/m.19160 type:complete len:203 (+) Transcript_12808:1150-1758(+)